MPGLTRLLCFTLILLAGVLLYSTGNAHGQSTDAKPKGTGSISGRVTIDDKDASGVAVAAFVVNVSNRRPAAQATTDNEGRYRLFGLAAATYRL